jgi:ATP-dependent Clp protease protease subunit
MMMIHNPATISIGDEREMQKAIDMLGEVKESIINAYEIKTGLGRGKIANLMDAESWMNAKKAVELGFADSILFDGSAVDKQSDEIEAMMFSRAAVTNSLLSKFQKPDNRVDAKALMQRLDLLLH